MTKQEYLAKLDELNLDKNRYCIIAGGVLLMHDLKESTADIDIKIRPDYFEELQNKFAFKKSPKYPNLYEISDDIEVAVREYDDNDIEFVAEHPTESLELTLEWMLEHNRPKDQEKIKLVQDYLNKNR